MQLGTPVQIIKQEDGSIGQCETTKEGNTTINADVRQTQTELAATPCLQPSSPVVYQKEQMADAV